VRNLKNNVVVMLTGVIQTNGRAANIAVVKSGDAGFDKKAIETNKPWRNQFLGHIHAQYLKWTGRPIGVKPQQER
jgi:hypothetical protein